MGKCFHHYKYFKKHHLCYRNFKPARVSCVWQGSASVPILVPLSSSDHHVELDMRYQSKNARYALTALANEIPNKHKTAAIAPRKNFKGILTSFDVLFFEILFLLGSP
jgi:hypothetical protein